MDLHGKVAVVTGACGDIGREIGMALARAGARTVLSDIRPESDAIGLLESSAGEAFYCRADVTDRAAVERLFDDAGSRFGTPDICVGNAAIVEVSPFLEISEASWQAHLDVNLTGCFHTGQAAARRMVPAGKQGNIIFVGSWVQDVPSANIAAYCVAKSGLKMLARSMALELGGHGIRVNLVAPGFVDAGLSGRLFQEKPGLRDAAVQYVPLGYVMTAADVAAAVMLLCSPAAAYMTGSTLLVDGGNSLFFRGGNP
jgi:glucose 1-dehydrogenase